jgi:hypothetical protein
MDDPDQSAPFLLHVEILVSQIAADANIPDNVCKPPKRWRPYRRKVLQIPCGPEGLFTEGVSSSPPASASRLDEGSMNPSYRPAGAASPHQACTEAGLTREEPVDLMHSPITKNVQKMRRHKLVAEGTRSSMPDSPESDDHNMPRTSF